MVQKTRKTAGGKILFRLTDDALIVANSGMPFTRKGVIAVCHSCISPKSDNPPDDTYCKENGKPCTDAQLPTLIREELLNTAVNIRKSKIGSEKQTTRAYSGRFALELLQNADDAAGNHDTAKLIGSKGIGFKSILEITDEPEIHSGNFHFRLETQKDGLRVPRTQSPISDIGWPGAVTVIRMPFRDAETRDMIHDILENIHADTLLFCQWLTYLEIQMHDSVRICEIERKNNVGFNSGTSSLTLKENGISEKWKRWSEVWDCEANNSKQLSVAFCLPEKSDEIEPVDQEDAFVRVFFPTNEKISKLKAIIHASYDVEISRKHFEGKQPNGTAIRKSVKDLVTKIVKEVSPATALRAFGDVDQGHEETEIGLLQNAIVDAVSNTCFVPIIGGGLVCPSNVRIWQYGLGKVVKTKNNVIVLTSNLPL